MSIFIKPSPGLVVLDPDGHPLPKDGIEVARTSFWTRRLLSEDVVEVTDREEEV